jgi:hypothetical protein
MKEEWKDIQNYEGLYQVSNLGRVKSFRRSTKLRCKDEYILKPFLANNGYAQVTLYNNTKKHKFLVHRLVACAFIPNPDNLPQINHKDEDRTNNVVENLEWCTAEYNNAYGTAKLRAIDTVSKPIEQVTFDGKVIAVYRSTRIASEILKINTGTLRAAVIKHSQFNGYFWRYSNINPWPV